MIKNHKKGISLISVLASVGIGSVLLLGTNYILFQQANRFKKLKLDSNTNLISREIEKFIKGDFKDRFVRTLRYSGNGGTSNLTKLQEGKDISLNFLLKEDGGQFPPQINCQTDYDDCESGSNPNKISVLNNRRVYGLGRINFFQLSCLGDDCDCSSTPFTPPCLKTWNLETFSSLNDKEIVRISSLSFTIEYTGTGTQDFNARSDCEPLTCGAGEFKYDSQGDGCAEICRECPVGQQVNGAKDGCDYCPAGTSRNYDQASCTSCEAGTYSITGSRLCFNCKAGEYSNAGASECTRCPYGRYNPNPAGQYLTSCIRCPAGQYTDGDGRTSAADCKSCLPGQTSNNGRLSGCR